MKKISIFIVLILSVCVLQLSDVDAASKVWLSSNKAELLILNTQDKEDR